MNKKELPVRRLVTIFVLMLLICGVSFFGTRIVAQAHAALIKSEEKANEYPFDGVPILLSPSGNYSQIRPNYIWQEFNNATLLHVFVSNASTGTVHNDWYSASSVCPGSSGGSGECGLHADEHLRTGNHTWWVRGSNGDVTSGWSDPMNFKIWNTSAPTGSVSKSFPGPSDAFTFDEFTFIWTENIRASWYKVYMTDSVGKLYNQYHRAADICYGSSCFLSHGIYAPLIHATRGLSELPTSVWIHWQVMPVNVAGNGDWTGYTKFWMYPP